MARHSLLACLLLLTASSADQSRWSRQISSYTADISDWVPLPGPGPIERQPLPPIKRQAVAEPRILAEPVYPGFTRPTGFSQDGFGSQPHFFRNQPASRPLYLQSVPAVPSAPQNYLTDQGFGQNIRFGLSQPNFLNQGFVSNQFPFENVQQINNIKPRPQVSNMVKFENFPKTAQLPSPQAKPFNTQPPRKIEAPKFVDGYRAEPNNTNYANTMKKKPQSLQKLKFETFDKVPKTEMVPPRSKSEKEEVQLLYVPVESLNRGNFNFRGVPGASQILSDPYAQSLQRPNPVKPTFTNDFQRLPKPVEVNANQFFNSYNQFKDMDQIPKYSTIASPFPTQLPVTPKPKKLKPHQPPLAIFMSQEAKKGNQIKVGDVLSSLKTAETVAVLDSVNPQTAPKVFIGPSSLEPPEKFVKFELPYLSNIENSDKKIRQLPFFVAPLSYNTPQGFAKIPFPSPHVGSVVINSQIKDTTSTVSPSTPAAEIQPNSYSTPQRNIYKQESRPVNQKPTISYYSTAPPKTNPPPNYQSNYYSIEPQVVSTVRTPQNQQANVKAPPKPGSYFLSHVDQYEPADFNYESERGAVKTPAPVQGYNIAKQTEATTPKPTPTTTKASTYPSQLLETHNPYSINQAFHFSTPLDYHNFFDESYATPGSNVQQPSQSPQPAQPSISSSTPTPTPKQETVTEKQHQSSPNYLQNYSPEINYNSEVPISNYPSYNSNNFASHATPEYPKPAAAPETDDNIHAISSAIPPTEYKNNDNNNYNTQTASDNSETKEPGASYETSSKSSYVYNQYENTYETETPKTTSTTTTSTTTTTRRTPTRGRGRPRYTTTPRTDSNESSTRTVVTRRPLRERRPQPNRSRYEPNKITTERATRRPIEPQENATKYSRNRTRGRVQYKPSESDDYQKTKHNSKEQDLAYQRDVLHQNYPVTIQERGSTVDIEAITEPSPKISSTKTLDSTYYDTENAYSNDRVISHHGPNTASQEEVQTYTSRFVEEQQTESPQISKSTFQSRSSFAPVEAVSGFGETSPEREEDSFIRQTTPIQKFEEYSHPTEPSSVFTEQNEQDSSHVEYTVSKQEEIATTPEVEITKTVSQEVSNQEEEENVVQTTPSYNRVRVRPGVVRQYHQASSTEAAKTKTERRRPIQPVTYRPAFDRRRTTMRVEEIGEDFRTKQVHSRPEVQEVRHPVYRPEPTTEPAVTSPSSQDMTAKRGVFRRRRPSYTTTTTEAASINSASTKKVYEVKNRFRGRRPTTEKATDKPDVSAETTTTTGRNIYNRYSNRPRLSERYNKKPEREEVEDQDSNYSINRPKYAEPETDQWSPKISSESFKPYNPNDIIEERKVTTETKDDLSELDIITAKNDYDDILLTVTPATNNRLNKNVPDIPPTLEALVEQSKTTQAESDSMSTFESMLEEVMKNLEEQDKDEYTTNVMKHKGGEIGEIPPERIISSEESYVQKTTTVEQHDATTITPETDDSARNEDTESKGRRRGFWKKVKVRPVTESIEAAESQYYPNTVNRIESPNVKAVHEKNDKNEKSKVIVTTYKPPLQFLKEIFDTDEEIDVLPTVDIPKLNKETENKSVTVKEQTRTEVPPKEVQTEATYGDIDLGTGSPSPAADNVLQESHPTASSEIETTYLDKTDGFSFMDYLFGVTSDDDEKHVEAYKNTTEKPKTTEILTTPEKVTVTTESTFIPEEITAVPNDEESLDNMSEVFEIKKVSSSVESNVSKEEHKTENVHKETTLKTDATTPSSLMDPANVVSTSMSTEVSHETEICFRGKCIKTNNDLL